jgi:DNA-binding transcriptional LysR family regulator
VGAVSPFQTTDMLAAFSRKFPSMQVRVRFGNSETALRDLLDFRTDVAVLAHFADDERLHGVRFGRSPVVVLVPKEHRFATRRALRIEELDGERMIVREEGSTTRKAIEAAFARARVKPQVIMELGSREAIREAVAKGIGLGMVAESGHSPDPRERMVRLSNAEVWTETHVVCLEVRRSARAVNAFFEIAEALVRKRSRAPRACASPRTP